jgi:hypothetical protein
VTGKERRSKNKRVVEKEETYSIFKTRQLPFSPQNLGYTATFMTDLAGLQVERCRNAQAHSLAEVQVNRILRMPNPNPVHCGV